MENNEDWINLSINKKREILLSSLKEALEKYKEKPSSLFMPILQNIMHICFLRLESYLNEPFYQEFSWKYPFIEVQIINDASNIEFNSQILNHPSTAGKALWDVFNHNLTLEFLYMFSKSSRVITQKNGTEHLIVNDKNCVKEINKQNTQEDKIEKALDLIFNKMVIPLDIFITELRKTVKITFVVEFSPLFIDKKSRESYYSLIVELGCEQDLSFLSQKSKNNILAQFKNWLENFGNNESVKGEDELNNLWESIKPYILDDTYFNTSKSIQLKDGRIVTLSINRVDSLQNNQFEVNISHNIAERRQPALRYKNLRLCLDTNQVTHGEVKHNYGKNVHQLKLLRILFENKQNGVNGNISKIYNEIYSDEDKTKHSNASRDSKDTITKLRDDIHKTLKMTSSYNPEVQIQINGDEIYLI